MKLLVTNDDGIAAEGLRALMSAARKLGDAVAVAPLVECSEVGHAVTTKLALRANRCGDDQFAVNGTPARLRAPGSP
jgi:5'-nucleotidase